MPPKKEAPASGPSETTELRRSSRATKNAIIESLTKTESSKKRVKPDADEEPVILKKAKVSNSTLKEAAGPVYGAFNLGDGLPAFALKNEAGEDIHTDKLADEKGVVIFLVPKADTPGCTRQACGFRDQFAAFKENNYDVYCLSSDKPAAQQKWQTKKALPYSLLSDPNREFITAIGAAKAAGGTIRSHFIFEKGGRLIAKQVPVKPDASPSLALEFIKSLNAK